MEKGVEFTKTYFKNRVRAIEELAARSEGFRDLCDDFATAHDGKLDWKCSSARVLSMQSSQTVFRSRLSWPRTEPAIVPFTRPRR
jgi:hypothetical protein